MQLVSYLVQIFAAFLKTQCTSLTKSDWIKIAYAILNNQIQKHRAGGGVSTCLAKLGKCDTSPWMCTP